jgi:Methylase involved in ubiquinone/menaquinone biosynthesis
MSQKNARFTDEDANAYFARNYGRAEDRGPLPQALEQRLTTMLARLPFTPRCVLEAGCCFGRNLEFYRVKLDAECFGLDMSEKAVNEGKILYPNLDLRVGDACAMPYEDDMFDMVVLGFFLCYLDPSVLFRVASEVNRVLCNDGIIVLHDFDSPFPFRNSFKHKPGLYMHKLDFRGMFLWNPAYSLIEIQALSVEGNTFTKSVNDRVSYSILYKASLDDSSIVTNPFGEV